MSRYRAEILCIFFNTKHFRGVLYCCYFALNVFKVNLVLKLQRKKHKGSQSTAHRKKKKVQGNKYASIMFRWTQPMHLIINNLLTEWDGINWYSLTVPELCLWVLTHKRQKSRTTLQTQGPTYWEQRKEWKQWQETWKKKKSLTVLKFFWFSRTLCISGVSRTAL